MQEEVNQPTTPPQAPDQMHSSFEEPHNSKVIPFIIVAALLVLVGAGSYILGTKKTQLPIENKVASQPSPTLTLTLDQTIDWKIYQDELFGFSLKYPNEWQATYEEKSVTIAQEVSKQRIYAGFRSANGIDALFNFEKNSNFVDNASFLNFTKAGYLSGSTIQEIYVDNTKAILSTALNPPGQGEGQKPSYMSIASFFNKGKTYSVSISSPQENGSQEQLLKLILSTFKFTQ